MQAAARDDLRGIVGSAVAAPSSHNTQPWSFRIGERTIDLLADRTRGLAVTDPDGRELTISCGAALLNLRCAAAARGLAVETEPLPDASNPDLLARVRLGPGDPDRSLAGLAAVIPERRTTRSRYSPRRLDEPLVESIAEAARAEGAWLEVLNPGRRAELAALVAEGTRAQFAEPAWRRELASWIRSPRGGDGIAIGGPAAGLARPAIRAINLGARVAATEVRRAGSASHLALLGTDGDRPGDWLVAGQALERALLTATGPGARASFFNQPCQVVALRPRLAELAGGPGPPQIVLGLGYPGREPAASPRRELDAVLLPDPAAAIA